MAATALSTTGVRPSDEQRFVRAVLEGFAIHDASIYSMEQRWELTSPRVAGMNQPLQRSGRCGFDEMGSAYDIAEFPLDDSSGDEAEGGTYERSAGGISTTWERGSSVGVIRPTQGLVGTGEFACTRAVDASGLRLSEALLGCRDVRVRSVDESGTVVLEGVLEIDTPWNRAIVAIDTQHGFAPSSIQMEDALGTLRASVVNLSDFRLHDGVWIAHEVQQEGFYYSRDSEMTPSKRSVRCEFDEEVSRQLGDRPFVREDPAVVAVMERAKATVLKGGRLPERAMYPRRTGRFEIVSLNKPIDCEAALPLQSDLDLIDVFHNLNARGEIAIDPTRPRDSTGAPRKAASGGYFGVIPDSVYPMQIHVVEGERFEASISIIQSGTDAIEVTKAHTTIPFATVEGPTTSPSNPFVERLVVKGIAASPGLFRGEVRFETTSEALPRGEARVAIRVLPALRATPKGITVGPSTPPGADHVVTLTRRAPSAHSVIGARWQKDVPEAVEVSVRTNGPDEISVRLSDPKGVLRAGAGNGLIELLGESGEVVATLPVAWCHLDALAAKP